MDLNKYNFTTAEFEMLNDALEHLPNKGDAAEIFHGILSAMNRKETPQSLEEKLELRKKEKEAEKKDVLENVRVLQGKLISLKRDIERETQANTNTP